MDNLPKPEVYSYECGTDPSSAAACSLENENKEQMEAISMAGGFRKKNIKNKKKYNMKGGDDIVVDLPNNTLDDVSPQNPMSNTIETYKAISQSSENSIYDQCVIDPNNSLCKSSIQQQGGNKYRKKTKSHKRTNSKNKSHKRKTLRTSKSHKRKTLKTSKLNKRKILKTKSHKRKI